MRVLLFTIAGCGLLAACADPLADVDRLSDVDLPPDAVATAAAPAPSETADAPGFLGRLLGGVRPAAAVVSAAPEIAPGTVLPYGVTATVCGLPESALGQQVAEASGHVLWDSAPGTIAPRTHYVTGIDGGCAVQFTAALAMFGDIGTHETVRYQLDDTDLPYSVTDVAYEAIKADFCGVPTGQPCGERLAALGRQTVYVNAYETFGTNPGWFEILLHDGAVVASAVKDV